jgi:hypothetical protein
MIWRESRQVLLVLAALFAARTAAAQTTGTQHAGHFPIDSTWLSYDSASKTVSFKLIAGSPGEPRVRSTSTALPAENSLLQYRQERPS